MYGVFFEGVESENGVFMIKLIQLIYGGIYICIGKNVFNEDMVIVQLRVGGN